MATAASAPFAFEPMQTPSFQNDTSLIDTGFEIEREHVPTTFAIPETPHKASDTLALATMTPEVQDPPQQISQPNDILSTPMEPMTTPANPLAWAGLDMTDPSFDLAAVVKADLESYEAEEAAAPEDVANNQPMQAYAKLQFEDGDFYVNTHAVELGRDMNAMKYERRRKRVGKQQVEEPPQPIEQGPSNEGDPSSLSNQSRPREQNGISGSNVSEAGGIIGTNVYSDEEESKHSRRRRKRLLTSNDSSQSQSIAPANLHTNGAELSFTSNLFTDGQGQGDIINDISTSRFNECQFVPIHPATGRPMSGISRKHIRIEYNSDKAFWELHVLGRNGVFVDEQFVVQNDVFRLRHNSEILVQGIQITFKLPDNARDNEEAVDSYDSDSPISSLESSPTQAVEGAMVSGSDVTSGEEEEMVVSKEPQKKVKLKLSLSKRSALGQKSVSKEKPAKADKQPAKTTKEKSEPEEQAPAAAEVATSIENETSQPPAQQPMATDASLGPPQELPVGSILAGLAPEEIPQKRKGPGRPPKNGVMSKRDEAIIKRKKKELQKAGQEIPPLADLLAMARAEAGSTVKKDRPDDLGEGDDIKPTIETGITGVSEGPTVASSTEIKADSTARPSQPSVDGDASKAKRVAKSPSPQKPESEYTEEELKKPQKTYVVLIHDALSNCATGIMDLQQIYDAIQKMYPYYKYRSQTQGWQSSIRHNLIGSEAFEEAGKIGKGRLWKINANYPIDKEKKRRAPTPPPERPSYNNHYYPNGQYPPYSNQGYSPYRPSPYGTPYGPPTTMPNGARPPPTAQRPGTYYSPYASNPSGQTHASPYGPPSRPPYAQPQNQQQANNAQTNASTISAAPGTSTPTQAPQPSSGQVSGTSNGVTQQNTSSGQGPVPPAGQSQLAKPVSSTSQSSASQSSQTHQQKGSLGGEETVDEIMIYHRQYVMSFTTSQEQDSARALFRKAVNRHIQKDKDHGPFASEAERKLSDHIGGIIENGRKRSGQSAPAPIQSNPASPAAAPPKPAQQTPPVPYAQSLSQSSTNTSAPPPVAPAQMPGQSQSQSHDKDLVRALTTATNTATPPGQSQPATPTTSTRGTPSDPISIDGPDKSAATQAVAATQATAPSISAPSPAAAGTITQPIASQPIASQPAAAAATPVPTAPSVPSHSAAPSAVASTSTPLPTNTSSNTATPPATAPPPTITSVTASAVAAANASSNKRALDNTDEAEPAAKRVKENGDTEPEAK